MNATKLSIAIEESNKLIAEFMGMRPSTDPALYFTATNGYQEVSLMGYHCSWDWLMPVVEKIDEVCGIDLHEWDEYINDALCTKSKEAVYGAATKFIKWYNDQSK